MCLLAISGARADSLDPRPPANAHLAANAATAQSSQSGLDARWKQNQATKAKLAGLKAVVKDVRDTRTPSRWLSLLAVLGLVIVQLRRKHKSLPQRRIAPYG
jgi:hypothetical protein